MSEDAINIGRNGGIRNGREYEGFTQAFERLKFHNQNDSWDYRMEDYLLKGVRVV